MDGGNADDGHRQLNLQNRSIDMAEPFGLVGMFVNVKAGDEGLVAADNDHGQQVGNHHNINQVQYGDHDGVSSMMLKLDTKCHNDLRNLQA